MSNNTISGEFFFRHRLILLGVLALVCLGDVAGISLTYLVYPGYVDNDEASIVTAAWRILSAHPSGDHLASAYGPYAYLIHSLMLAIFGPSVVAGKLAAAVAVVAFPLVVSWSGRRYGVLASFLGLIIAAAFVLTSAPVSFLNRPDIFLALLVVVAVGVMERGGGTRTRDLTIAVCLGLAVSMKIYAGIYFLPVVLYRVWGRGVRPVLEICLVAVIVAILPFALSMFSLGDYFVLFINPVGKLLDAGLYTFFPLMAIAVDLVLRNLVKAPRRRIAWAGAVLVAVLVLVSSIASQKRFLHSLNWGESRGLTADIRSIMVLFPGQVINMGAGANYKTYYRTLLAFAGRSSTSTNIPACTNDLWLIPKGETPFQYGGQPLDESFRLTFIANHSPIGASVYFDIWGCLK